MNRRDFIKGTGAAALSVAVIANSEHARPPIADLKPDRRGQDDVFSGDFSEDIIIDLSQVDDYSLEQIAEHASTLGGGRIPLATRERVSLTMRAPHQAMLDWLHNVHDYRQNVRLVLKMIPDPGKAAFGHYDMRPVSWDSQLFNAVTVVDFPAVIVSATVQSVGPELPPMLTLDLERVYV